MAVEGFVLKLLNTNCPELQERLEGPRLEGRINLTLVVQIVPIEDGELVLDRAFATVTKEFSSKGVAVVLPGPYGLDEALLGFRWCGGKTWIRAKARHLNPLGGGLYQIGFRMSEKICPADYPQLVGLPPV